MPEVKIDEETLKGQESLSEDQQAAIAQQTIDELNGEDTKKKDEDLGNGEPGATLSDGELLETPDEELDDEQKAKKSELAETRAKEEEERLLAAEDKDLDESERTRKAELVKARKDAKAADTEKEIEAYAKENNITLERAKEEVEHIAKINEKYKGDPKLIAKAQFHALRNYNRLESEYKSLKEGKEAQERAASEISVDAVKKMMEEGKVPLNGKQATKEQIVDAYRAAYPDLTDSLEDDKVLSLAAKEYKGSLDSMQAEEKGKSALKAKEKRESVLTSLGEADKQFLPKLKPMLDSLTDAHILHEAFDIKTYVTYAKGEAYDERVKAFDQEKKDFGDKEYNRGLEQAKILGEKRIPEGKKSKVKTIALDEAQKKRAREMFDNPEITEEMAYDLYKDFLNETK